MQAKRDTGDLAARPAPRQPDAASQPGVDLAPEGGFARRSVAEGVADHIRQLVFFGRLRDGERVPQREIAETLGVSSVPVREALAALQREGVVTIEPNRGAFVNGLDADIVTEQFYVFGRIYGLAARRTTERADPGVLATLSDLARRIGVERDLEALLELSIRFQMRVAHEGGSKRLRALFGPLSRLVPGNFYVTIPGSAEVARRGTAAMTEAIASGRADAAEKACWAFIDETGQLVAPRFRRGSDEARSGPGPLDPVARPRGE